MENTQSDQAKLTFFQYATKGFVNKLTILGSTLALIGGFFLFSLPIPTQLEDAGDIVGLGIFGLIIVACYLVGAGPLGGIIMAFIMTLACIFFAWKGFLIIFAFTIPLFFWALSYKGYKNYLETVNKA